MPGTVRIFGVAELYAQTFMWTSHRCALYNPECENNHRMLAAMDIDTKTSIAKVSASELKRRRRNVESALGSLRIEGLNITPAADAISAQYLRGEISLADLSKAIADL